MADSGSPRLSIIIPTLDEADSVVASLTALQACRGDRCEIVLVDGGSSDDTVALARPMVDQLIELNERGRAVQMNAGAAAASGDYLWFLHADTHAPVNAAAGVVAALEQRRWGRFDLQFNHDGWQFRLIARCINWRSRVSGIATGDQGIFVRRSVFDEVGQFPLQPLMEDIEISRRLARYGRPVCRPEKLVTSSRRWQENGTLRTILLMWRLRFLYFFGVSPVRLAARYRSVR